MIQNIKRKIDNLNHSSQELDKITNMVKEQVSESFHGFSSFNCLRKNHLSCCHCDLTDCRNDG